MSNRYWMARTNQIMDPFGIYLSMHCEWCKPGKVRVVFDCAASQSGVSLNNQCTLGPDVLNKLLSVLLRFRHFHHSVMVDIGFMHVQVRLPSWDRNALCFLWFVNYALRHFRIISHSFGGVWYASSSTYALRCTGIDAGASDVVRKPIMRLMYIDNLVTVVSDKKTTSLITSGTKDTLERCGFWLTTFVVNDPELLGQIAPDDCVAEVKEITREC